MVRNNRSGVSKSLEKIFVRWSLEGEEAGFRLRMTISQGEAVLQILSPPNYLKRLKGDMLSLRIFL